MPKSTPKLTLNLNLLKPQSNPEKLPVRLIHWLLSTGRFIFVFVEAIVLIAFAARFKLDADLAARKEAIEEQIPYIESLKSYEIVIRQTQLKLSTIDNVKRSSLDWPLILKKIADQIPTGIKLTSINIERNITAATIHITAQTQNNRDLTNFVAGLKEDNTFSNVNIASIGMDGGIIKFTVDAAAKLMSPGGKSL